MSMQEINWRERFRAALIHLSITAAIGVLVALLIYTLWFPKELASLIRGTKLFFLVVGCDLALGPLISLAIYSSKKSKRELLMDYSVVAAVQLAALIYGLMVVANTRPVVVAFSADRIEVVTAAELEKQDLAEAEDPLYKSNSWFGPREISIKRPQSIEERNRAVFMAVAGKDLQLMPKYYQPYDAAISEIKQKARRIDELLNGSGAEKHRIERAIEKTNKAPTDLRWLLAHHRFGFGTVLMDGESLRPLIFINVDPVWVKWE